MKKTIAIALLICIIFSGCQGSEGEQVTPEEDGNGLRKVYKQTYLDAFDTVITIILHEEDEETAKEHFDFMHQKLLDLHGMFTIYDPWSGGNNLYNVNEMAGKEPVKLPEETMAMLEDAVTWYHEYSHKTNIAIGPVTDVWGKYRDGFVVGPDVLEEDAGTLSDEAKLPPMELLEEANRYTSLDHLVLDHEAGTAYLDDPHAKLDVGAVAKGYAVEILAKESEKLGVDSGLISAGGNVRIIGKPMDGDRTKWSIGVENPDEKARAEGDGIKEIFFLNKGAIVTSGDYQRYYVVDGKPYHHLIDPDTLMPGEYCRSVTIFHPDSGFADFLSTATFLSSLEDGYKLIDAISDAEAFWIFADGSVKYTPGLEAYMSSFGATSK